jgi:hypothetical protein
MTIINRICKTMMKNQDAFEGEVIRLFLNRLGYGACGIVK